MRAKPAGLVADVDEFFRRRPAGVGVDVHNAAHALEDLPEDVRIESAKLLSTPAGIDFKRRAFDVLENAAVDIYGHLELFKVLHFLSQYPVTSYTYGISSYVSRGERASAAKLASLYKRGFGATLNLCAETPDGDAVYLQQAGLTGRMAGDHVGIVDCNPPSDRQMTVIFDILADLQARGVRTYIHCEAGKARTGVVIACYRMAVMGWNIQDALTEATNFGCTVPMQQAYIQNFGAELQAQYDARTAGAALPHPTLGAYPLRQPGSVKATPKELSATLASVAQSEKNGLE